MTKKMEHQQKGMAQSGRVLPRDPYWLAGL